MKSMPKRIHVSLAEEVENVRREMAEKEKENITFLRASKVVANYSKRYRQRAKKPLWQREI